MHDRLKHQLIIQRMSIGKGNLHKKMLLSVFNISQEIYVFLHTVTNRQVVGHLELSRRFATRNKLFINLRASISDFLSLLAPMRPFKVSFNLLLKVLQASKVAFRSESILSENLKQKLNWFF